MDKSTADQLLGYIDGRMYRAELDQVADDPAEHLRYEGMLTAYRDLIRYLQEQASGPV
jgi:hypothetical protein